ncbi:hypothetical protein [Streptomyces chilikensis]|uniref:hypothetical protein n=1 Tax=Streptomyces chilikensis TaxID=1194079 RepID=UPI000ACD0CC1|nr:hypothetical protein [Streptomyces chilikensis]
MITLTPDEKAIHRALLGRARAADPAKPLDACLTYKALGLVTDPEGRSTGMSRPPFRAMFPALGHVSAYEVEHGRPMLSALVVSENSHAPGPGFAGLARRLRYRVDDDAAFWQEELERTVRFWSAQDPVLVLDAVVDRLLCELQVVRDSLRRLGQPS